MSRNTFSLPSDLYDYLLDVSLRESALMKELREETALMPVARMQIAPEQGQFMSLLVRLCGFRRCIEVGVFTGYSSLCVAQAMPEDGYLLACDLREDWTKTAQDYWGRAGVADKIDLRLAPAIETLQACLEGGQAGSYDFAFIDADKRAYIEYYEACLQLIRPGGLIAVDNTLWSGRVVDPADQDNATQAVRAFNQHVSKDDRVELSMIPIADGLTLCRKR